MIALTYIICTTVVYNYKADTANVVNNRILGTFECINTFTLISRDRATSAQSTICVHIEVYRKYIQKQSSLHR